MERPDVVGAIFGQTEGLLGSDLDLKIQKNGKVQQIDVQITSSGEETPAAPSPFPPALIR